MIIKNVDILTLAEKSEYIKNAAIVIEGQKIKSIITDGNVPQDKDVIDGKGMLAVPGFINTHTHSAMTFLRNYGSDMNLQDWLFKKIFPAEDKLNGELTYWFNRLAEIEYIKSGITTHVDNYFFMDTEARAIEESGARGVIARSVSGCSDPDCKKLKESLELIKRYDNTLDGRLMCTMSPHAIYTSNTEYLKRVFDETNAIGAGTQIHMSETKKEVSDCLEQYKMTPFEYVDSLGGFDTKGIKVAAHCVHVNENDKAIMREKNISVAANISSNLKLASGIPNIPDLIASGINVSIGTDGASSNNNLNMFNEIRLCSLLYKGLSNDPTVMKALDVLKLATVNGARAIGRDDLGTIEVGKSADIVLLDKELYNVAPTNDIEAAVVYSMSAENVKTVICNGRVIMKDRNVIGIDEEETIANVKRLTASILG